MNNVLCLSFIIIFFFSFQKSLASPSCDLTQTAESRMEHSTIVLSTSMEQIFNHFYQDKNAFKKPPFDFLKRGELKGFKTTPNSKSKGNNSYIENLSLAQKSQYYISCDGRRKNPLCNNPPSYLWGGMGWYTRNDKGELILDLHGNDELTMSLSRHPGLDCSGLTYAIYSNANLRVTTDLSKNPSFETADNTPARSYMNTSSADSCFKDITTSILAPQELQTGDIIVWKRHMIMVESVGLNPFGTNHILKSSQCNIKNIDPTKSTLVVVNSKGSMEKVHSMEVSRLYNQNPFFYKYQKYFSNNPKMITGVGIGISKQKIRDFFYSAPEQIFNLALYYCEKKFQKNVSYNGDAYIIRHKAFFPSEEKPCGCFSRELDHLALRPTL